MENTRVNKTANLLYLPIRQGEKVRFINTDGNLCETRVMTIIRSRLLNDMLYITFASKNSIYTDVPVSVSPTGIEQDITRGNDISLGGNDREKVEEIYEVNNGGIIVRTDSRHFRFADVPSPANN